VFVFRVGPEIEIIEEEAIDYDEMSATNYQQRRRRRHSPAYYGRSRKRDVHNASSIVPAAGVEDENEEEEDVRNYELEEIDLTESESPDYLEPAKNMRVANSSRLGEETNDTSSSALPAEYEKILQAVVYGSLQANITGLDHFQDYIIEVLSCLLYMFVCDML
jgi:hypothetical protein